MDTLELYRWAAQDPETHAVVLNIVYEGLRPGRQPVVHYRLPIGVCYVVAVVNLAIISVRRFWM